MPHCPEGCTLLTVSALWVVIHILSGIFFAKARSEIGTTPRLVLVRLQIVDVELRMVRCFGEVASIVA